MDTTSDTVTILYVNDEVQAHKWSVRTIGIGYEVLTANSVEKAKTVLRDSHGRISVVLTDFRMPGADGTGLLRFIDAKHDDIATILITAYVNKDLLVQAVSTGRAFKILERPYQPENVRRSLQEALAPRQDRLLRAQHLIAVDETLALLAYRLNTPLAAISNFTRGIRMHVDQTEPTLGALPKIDHATDRAQDSIRYCPSVIATFLNSIRSTYGKPGTAVTSNSAGGLIHVLFDTCPFTNAQHEWVTCQVEDDFPIQTLPNYVMLALSSFTSNALQALRQINALRLEIVAGHGLDPGNMQHAIRIEGNDPGIVPDVLTQLTTDLVTARAEEGGSGMDMIFCTRIMQSLGRAVAIDSAPSAGMYVTLVSL